MKPRIVTVLIMAISVAWTAWILLSGNGDDDWRRFGISNGFEVFGGDYWTLVTSMFVHVGAMHLFFNLYWINILGSYVEEHYGYKFYAWLILISGFCSSALELSLGGHTGVGLSGVVYAIFGLLWGARLFGGQTLEILPKQRVQLFLGWLVLCIILTASGTMAVGNVAHVTGLIVGLLAAFALSSATSLAKRAVPAVVLVCGTAVIFSPWSSVWLASRATRAHQHGQWEVAEAYYSRVLKRLPNDPWALQNRGNIRRHLGREAQGNADLSRANQAIEDLRKNR